MDRLAAEDRPVALNFIFATCTTICPVMTSTFAQVRRELGAAGDQVHFVSVTIDPEYDTPAVLARFAEKFGATAGWDFLTGSAQDVNRVSRAFGIGSGSKFGHRPITFLRQPGQAKWVRLEGLGGGSALADELRSFLK